MIDHRGFSPQPPSLTTYRLDASLASSLEWEVEIAAPDILWELDFGIESLAPAPLASYQLAVRTFAERVWEKHAAQTVGVILYKGKVPPFPIEEFADYLHHLAAALPDEVAPFALFDCEGDPMLFSKEIFPYVHLGFRSGPIGAVRWGETIEPLRYDGKVGVVLPLREKGLRFDELKPYLGGSYRLIAEPYITEEWDDLDELIIFPHLISSWGMRMVKGFEAAGGKIKKVFGVEGFEPPTLCSQSRCASQTALYPEGS